MKLLKSRILQEAEIPEPGVLKVDMFLNHQIDVSLLNEIGKEFYRRFANDNVNKILTVEASGIGIACIAAQYFGVPVVFAKKGINRNVGNDVYSGKAVSFTKCDCPVIGVSKRYLSEEDRVLILDDFLAHGSALMLLSDIVRQSGAELVGAGIVIEKAFQPGGKKLRETGLRIESLAVIKSMDNGLIVFDE